MKMTLTQAAQEFQSSQETLRKRLVAAGHEIPKGNPGKKGRQFTVLEIHHALAGDKEAAMTRKLQAEADEQERENRVANGELISVEQAAQVYGRKLGSMCQMLDAMGAQLDSRLAAATEPVECRKIINEYCESVKKSGREA